MRNKLKILGIVVLFIIGILFMNNNAYSVTVCYGSNELSGTEATIYYDYGDGYLEEQSKYVVIEENKVTFPLQMIHKVQNIRLVPIRVVGDCTIEQIVLNYEGIAIGSFEIENTYMEKETETSWPTIEYNRSYWKRDLCHGYVILLLLLKIMTIVWLFSIVGISRHIFIKLKKRQTLKYELNSFKKSCYIWFSIGYFPVLLDMVVRHYKQHHDMTLLFFMILLVGMINMGVASMCTSNESTLWDCKKWNEICGLFVKVSIVYVVYYIMKNYLVLGIFSVSRAITNLFSVLAPFNLLWMFLLILLIYYLLGNGIANAVLLICSAVIIIGNAIKISFHNTLLTPMDFIQIPDMLRIATAVLTTGQILMIVGAIVAVVVLLIVFRKKIILYLRPSIKIIPACICLIIFAIYTNALLDGKYNATYNIGYKHWVEGYVSEACNGMYLNNMFNFAHISSNAVSKPDGYGEEYMAEIEQDVLQKYNNSNVTDVKPNVICIMAESLFDLRKINGLSFNEEIYQTIDSLGASTLISPRYGGYTAAIEYEALTGLSLYFYKDGTMPYTTYYQDEVNSVANEFKNNGYHTITFHPNTGSFYNRERAYALMGFDEINTIEDIVLEEGETIDSQGYCTDKAFGEKLIDMIEAHEEPVFMFGVSIAGHYIEGDHDSDTTMRVTDTVGLTAEERHVLQQTADAYQETDEMIRMLVEYVDQCERPTILYVFGDHLPPLPMWQKLNYLNDKYNKYGTILLGYSNYKTIDFPEYMTPNYLPAQMIIDAEIEHNTYWDYLYTMRDTLPVFQKEFVVKTPENEELIKLYKVIQYDLMFGEQYLLK